MADYGKLLSRIWSDPEFTALNAHAQQLFCLLISYPTRNYAGVLPLTLKRWAKASADSTVASVTEALKHLTAARFIVVDWESEEVLIRTYIRNDEVYRQPNLLRSARKSALQVESAALRWALHRELRRLPDHKEAEATEVAANQLVEGISEPFAEPFPEGLAEPFAEPPGVGVSYVSREREHLHLHPSPTPAPPPIAEPPAANGISATPGANLVRKIIPSSHDDSVRTELRIQASALIKRGAEPDDVEAALRLWLTKTGIGPRLLPSLLSDVIKTRDQPAPKPHKMRALVNLAAEERALEQAQATRKELP